MIRGAIFDFDGTLFDSMFIWERIGGDYLRSIGREPRENLSKTFQSMTLRQAADYLRSEYGVTRPAEAIMDGVNRMIEDAYAEVVQPKTGVRDFLRELKDRGVKMCIATATDRYLIESALARCGLCACFSEIFTCSSVGRGKDEPDIFEAALRCLGTEKHATLVFEDALYAARTAKRAGFSVVGVRDVFEEDQAELKALADLYLSDFSDFTSFWKFASGR